MEGRGGAMNLRQRILKIFYPLLMRAGKISGKRTATHGNSSPIEPPVSFYSLAMVANDGSRIPFSAFRGKKVMLVNTASECGYTAQYAELQMLYEQFPDRLVILGFPSNDFGEQEKGNDEEIANFCKSNYGVSFPLAKKSSVVKGAVQDNVFEWLTNKQENGWNEQAPVWNFYKYLVDEHGLLIYFFEPSISPLSGEVIDLIIK